MQIPIEAGMGELVDDVMDHVSYVVLETTRCPQSWTGPEGMAKEVNSDTCAEFAEELMISTVDLTVPKVRSSAGLAYKTYMCLHSSQREKGPVQHALIYMYLQVQTFFGQTPNT